MYLCYIGSNALFQLFSLDSNIRLDGNEKVTGPTASRTCAYTKGTVSRLVMHVSKLLFMQPYDTDFSVSFIAL